MAEGWGAVALSGPALGDPHPQVQQYAIKALACYPQEAMPFLDGLKDVARDPTRKDYVRIAGDARIRPDFYLPEFDLYIEYWGMNTPEYNDNKLQKRVLYQRAGKKLISLSYREFDTLESVLADKLARYIRL